MKDVVVIGAGLSGLTAALRLAQAGICPLVFERHSKPGGLARTLRIADEPIEAFYHHLFTTDTAYIDLATELGLANRIEWLPSRMGIFTADRMWDFGTPLSLLKFHPLPWPDKLRFVLSTLRLQRTQDPTEFEQITAAEWIRRHQGEQAWKIIWGPLLYQKFAEMAEDVAMVWLWRKLSLRGRSRSVSGMGERLGYMKGSFAVLVDRLTDRIRELGGEINLQDPVRRLDRQPDGSFTVTTAGGKTTVGKVLAAVPVPDYLEIAGHLLEAADRSNLQTLRATGAICTLLELDHSLTPYYWLNIADSSLPFGGLIEHSNYIDRSRYGGTHLVYISNYLFPDHPLFRAPKSEVMEAYLPGLKRVNRNFRKSWIRKIHHFRAEYAQPVVTLGYRKRIPATQTPVDGLFLCCMAQIYPEDRGQNYAVIYGEQAAQRMLEEFPEPAAL
ncbi:MAG: NAD(P)/FAD-dependent oxidoreductase [Thermoanaerobaculales bacterium]|nr:NAD(P)/FAD-dependent oxidoreductase [Thermoanaerobaculales bacterium]